MESTVVYYFTGTGNTLTLARQIAGQTNARLVSIPAQRQKTEIDPQAETIIVVSPVYYGDLPLLVQSFLSRLTPIETSRVLLVLGHSGEPGRAARTAADSLAAHGGKLAGTLAIRLPHNAVRADADPASLFAPAAEAVTAGLTAFLAGDPLPEMDPGPDSHTGPGTRTHLTRVTSIDADTILADAVHAAGQMFTLAGDCHGCGMCFMSCPVDNIVMVEKKPHWLDHCENCLACYSQCPHQAIATPLVEPGYVYHAPGFNFKDLVKQKRILA